MSRLRERRLELGLTQSQLAARAGVSRQLIAAVETDRNIPSVDAAIRLARSLTVAVEELFASASAPLTSALGDQLRDGAAVRVGRVGERVVAAEAPHPGLAGTGWVRADGVVDQGELRPFGDATVAGVVVAGCDPALAVADAMLAGQGPHSMLSISAPTGASLKALESGLVHAAVVHDRRDLLPSPRRPVARLHFARWLVGIAVPNGSRDASIESILSSDLVIVQREEGAGSQRALHRALSACGLPRPPSGPIAPGHLEAAHAAATLGGAAVTTEGAARAFGLDFISLEEHVVEIWFAETWFGERPVEGFAELLARRAFTDRVAQLGGYDLSGCGTVVSGSGA
jgi:DNA-binding XRE family transcriptional regulator